jgi:hypothetical protein
VCKAKRESQRGRHEGGPMESFHQELHWTINRVRLD